MKNPQGTIKQLECDLGRDLTATERRYIQWLHGWDKETVKTITGLFKELGESNNARH